MQSVLSRIWTRIAMSISYHDNDYTMGTGPSLDDTLANFPLVAAASFTNSQRLKTPNNELVRIKIKTTYNRLNDYNWKHRI